MPRFEAQMGGNNGDYKLVLYTSNDGTNVTAQLYWRRAGGTGYSSWNGAASFNITIGGVSVASSTYNFNAPAGGAIGETWIGGGVRNVGAVGSVGAAGFFNTDTSDAGYGEVYGSQSVATVPSAPTNMAGTPDQITSHGMRYRYRGNNDGGSPIIRWEYQVSTSSTFSGAPVRVGTMSGDVVRDDLNPLTRYYWRARGVNAIGAGAWSPTVSAVTLAANAPGLSVVPSLSGTQASLTLTPDSTQPTVDRWYVEYRLQGSGTSTPIDFATTTTTVGSLAPGSIYEWRASAKSGSYQSPWTAWQAVQQPNPNIAIGKFYDGNTPDTIDLDYVWTGTTNKSTTEARAPQVKGWATTLGASQGKAVLTRSSGGRSRPYAARLTVTADATAAGLGIENTVDGAGDVVEGGIYTASAHVRLPDRAQIVGVRLTWRDAAFAPIGSPIVSAGTAVAASADYVRISLAPQTAPSGAVRASIAIVDVNPGSGWTPWQGGDVMLVDDVMLTLGNYPYFDGDTPDADIYVYEWTGTAGLSASSRTTVATSAVDPLADPDCPAPPAPPRPPQIEDACIDDITSWRRYWVVIPPELVPRWVSVVPTITLTSGAQATRQARIRFYPNPDDLTPEDFTDITSFSSEQVVTYIPPTGVFTIDGVSQNARAVVGSSGSLPADHMLFGSGGTPVSWPLLSCGSGYLMSVDVPLDAPINNLAVDVALTPRM